MRLPGAKGFRVEGLEPGFGVLGLRAWGVTISGHFSAEGFWGVMALGCLEFWGLSGVGPRVRGVGLGHLWLGVKGLGLQVRV